MEAVCGRIVHEDREWSGTLNHLPIIGEHEYAVKFAFAASNNESEYEALILGLQLCKVAGANDVQAHCDSQLIVSQIRGEYEAKEDSMKMYLTKVKSLISDFLNFDIQHIPRSENQ